MAPTDDADHPAASLPTRRRSALPSGKRAGGLVAMVGDGARSRLPHRFASLSGSSRVLVARSRSSGSRSPRSVSWLGRSSPWTPRSDPCCRAPEAAGRSPCGELLGHTSRVPELDNGFFTRTDVDFTCPAATLAEPPPRRLEIWEIGEPSCARIPRPVRATGRGVAKEVRPVWMTSSIVKSGGSERLRSTFADPENFFHQYRWNGYASANDLLLQRRLTGTSSRRESKKLLRRRSPGTTRCPGCWAYPYPTSDGGTTFSSSAPAASANVKLVSAVLSGDASRASVF